VAEKKISHVKWLLVLLLMGLGVFPSHVFAVSLPQCRSGSGLTICVTGYEVAGDLQSAVVHGTVEQRLIGLVRVLSVHGWVYDQSGTVLGSGVIVNLPLDLPYGEPVGAEAELQSNYSPTQLAAMNIQSVRVVVVAEYCLPYQFWAWSGCFNMPPYQYETTLTTADLQNLYATYAT